MEEARTGDGIIKLGQRGKLKGEYLKFCFQKEREGQNKGRGPLFCQKKKTLIPLWQKKKNKNNKPLFNMPKQYNMLLLALKNVSD